VVAEVTAENPREGRARALLRLRRGSGGAGRAWAGSCRRLGRCAAGLTGSSSARPRPKRCPPHLIPILCCVDRIDLDFGSTQHNACLSGKRNASGCTTYFIDFRAGGFWVVWWEYVRTLEIMNVSHNADML
jgi:hypothetical protein